MRGSSVDKLKALAHPARFAIMQALSEGERNVGEIEQIAQIGQPALSQQLAILRDASLVRSRRSAKLVFYMLDTEALAELEIELRPILESQDKAADRSDFASTGGVAMFARMTASRRAP